jgi:hypothetical protein
MAEVYCKRTSCRHNQDGHCNCSVIELAHMQTRAALGYMGHLRCGQYERRPVDEGRIDDLVSGRATLGKYD